MARAGAVRGRAAEVTAKLLKRADMEHVLRQFVTWGEMAVGSAGGELED